MLHVHQFGGPMIQFKIVLDLATPLTAYRTGVDPIGEDHGLQETASSAQATEQQAPQ